MNLRRKIAAAALSAVLAFSLIPSAALGADGVAGGGQAQAQETALDAPALSAEALYVGYDKVTLAAPSASMQDSDATVQYRASVDGQTWGYWQDSADFDSLLPNTITYFQARYRASEGSGYTDSQASQAISLTPKASSQTVKEVSTAEQFVQEMSNALTDGTETVIKLGSDVIASEQSSTGGSVTVPTGAIVTLTGSGSYVNELYGRHGITIADGAVVTVKDMTLTSTHVKNCWYLPANHANWVFKLEGETSVLNICDSQILSDVGSAPLQGKGTVNLYSGVVRNISERYAVGDGLKLKLIPCGDAMVEGGTQLDGVSASASAVYMPVSSASTLSQSAGEYTALSSDAVDMLNSGENSFDLSGLKGVRINTSAGASAVPTKLASPVIAEEGSEQAQTANVVYKRENYHIVFTAKNIPQGAALYICGIDNGVSSWNAGSDAKTGFTKEGQTITAFAHSKESAGSGTMKEGDMTPNTEYSFQFEFCAVEAGYSDSSVVEAKITTSFTAVQLDPPDKLSDDVYKNGDNITLRAPAASAQDENATVQYSCSIDGTSWSEWQSSTYFDGLKPVTTYSFRARYVGSTELWLPSNPSEPVSITTTEAALEAPSIDLAGSVISANSITVTAPKSAQDPSAKLLYRITEDGEDDEAWSDWQESGTFENLTSDTFYFFQAKYEAVDGTGYLDSPESETVFLSSGTDANAAALYIDSGKVKPDGTVELQIGVRNNPGVISIFLMLMIDTFVIEPVEVKNGSLMAEPTYNIDVDEGLCTIYWENSTAAADITSDGVLCTVVMKPAAGTQIGDVGQLILMYDEDSTFDFDENPVSFQTQDGMVVIEDHQWGEAEYVWSGDRTTCTASRSCVDEDCATKATQSETVEVAKTHYDADGVLGEREVYTAKFENEAFVEQTYTEYIDLTVSFDVPGKVTASGSQTVAYKTDYEFNLGIPASYDVEVSAEVNGENVELASLGEGAYSISGEQMTGDLTVSVKGIARLWGPGALDTMLAISAEGWDDGSCETVVIATSDGYWDALSASGLAGLLGCPVLMTSGQELSEQTKTEVKRLGAKSAYIVGGESAVSPAVQAAIEALGVSTARVSGSDAVGTAVAVFEKGEEIGDWGQTCVVATAGGYWDALSAAPYAYWAKAPIFLVDASSGLPSLESLLAVREGGFANALISGGTGVVSEQCEAWLSLAGVGQPVRKAGADAVGTSSEVAAWCLDQGMNAEYVSLASGDGYWDALSGAALCGSKGCPILLATSESAASIEDVVVSNKAFVSLAYVFGGTSAVSEETYGVLSAALE